MMDQLIQEFPQQLKEALEIGRNAQITKYEKPIQQVLVAGMGGSGIGANFCIDFTRGEIKVPYMVTKGYSLPAFVNENTLLICSSYSGNTEETLSCFEEALKMNARIVVVASGGKLIAKAKEHNLDYIQLPAGKPSPRACLGYSFVQQLFILHAYDLISDATIKQVESSIPLIEKEMDDIKAKAKNIANFINGKLPIIYSTSRMEPVAVRLRQQLNENSKILCWHHTVPEMNHNELVGWREQNGEFAVIILRNKDDYYRNQARLDINKEIYEQYCDTIIEIFSKGDSLVERSLYLVHLGDWVTWYVSELRNMDAVEVKVIDYLKGELAKV